jgi:uncharacterized protein
MSEASGHKKNTVELVSSFEAENALQAEDVRQYLVTHPEFFCEFPALVESMVIPHQQKGSVSLFELQGEQLRGKVRQLSHKLSQLISIAKRNEEIYRVYADLNLRLLKCTDISDVQYILEEVMQEKLQLSAVSLKPFKGAHALPEIQQKLFTEKRFKKDMFFFGRLSEHEKQLLFTDNTVGSVALMLLGMTGELGILAVASKDASHFHPEMDTLLITQLQQFLNILLPKLMEY